MHYVGPDGTKLTMAMSNAEGLSAGGLRVDRINQTEGVRVAGEATGNIIRFLGWIGLAKTGIEAAEGVSNEIIEATTN